MEEEKIIFKDEPLEIKEEPVWDGNDNNNDKNREFSINKQFNINSEMLIKDEPIINYKEIFITDLIKNIYVEHNYCHRFDKIYLTAQTTVEEEIPESEKINDFAFIDVNNVPEPELDLNDKYSVISNCTIYCPKCNDGNLKIILKECRKCKAQCIIKCDICKVKFTSYYSFKSHLKDHYKIKEYTYHCNFCTYKTTDSEELVIHKKINHGSRLSAYKCKICDISFRQQSALRNHSKFCTEALNTVKITLNRNRSSENKNTSEDTFSKIGYDVLPLNPKAKDFKNPISRYCSACNLTFLSEFEGKKRVVLQKCQKCSNLTTWQCTPCKQTFERCNSLLYHLKHGCNAKKLYICRECGYSTPNITNMKQHVACKHSGKDLRRKCSKCEKVLKNVTYLKRHELRCGSEPNLKCKYCPKKTHYKRIFRNHLLKVHKLPRNEIKNIYDHVRNEELEASRVHYDPLVNKEALPYKIRKKEIPSCNLCGRTFTRTSVYSMHIKKCGKEPPLQCDHCSFKTFFKIHLTNHIVRFHRNIMDDSQDINSQPKINLNSYRFLWKGIIVAHCIICNEARSVANRYKRCYKCKTTMIFKCVKCNDKQFCNHLEQYMKQLVHDCDKCSKGFPSVQLLYHHKMYCGLPPRYKCSYCPYKTKFKSCMERHMRYVHPDTWAEKIDAVET